MTVRPPHSVFQLEKGTTTFRFVMEHTARFALNAVLFIALVVVAFHVSLGISIWAESQPDGKNGHVCLAMMSGFATMVAAWAVHEWIRERRQRFEAPAVLAPQTHLARSDQPERRRKPVNMTRLQRPGDRVRHRKTPRNAGDHKTQKVS